MVEVICDTNFLIHLATRRIKNIDNLDMEIGSISFIVPEVVKNELIKLQEIPEKNQEITMTLNFIKKFKIISINGTYADQELINYAKNHKCSIFVIAGSIQDSEAFIKKYGVNEAYSIVSRELSLEDALEHPTENLIAISRLAAKDFKKNYEKIDWGKKRLAKQKKA